MKLPNELKKKFQALAVAMSPENLSWDGSRPEHDQDREYKQLKAAWARLERLAGHRVGEAELWE